MAVTKSLGVARDAIDALSIPDVSRNLPDRRHFGEQRRPPILW